MVKGTKFQNIKDVDDPVKLAKFYCDAGADELVFYDITASGEDRKNSLQFIKEVKKEIDIPFCIGGGVSMVEDFEYIIGSGASKVSVNSAAIRNPNLIKEASVRFGKGRVVLSIDAKKNDKGSWDTYINGGREKTPLDAVKWAIIGAELGAGEIVVNSMDEDGMKNGYDLELLKEITSAVDIPVIASGGAGKKEHFLDAIIYANADGVLAASVFHFGVVNIIDLKSFLKENGVKVKM